MDNWAAMPPSEKKKHNKNIEELGVLKLKLINREVEWEAVKPEFETLWTLEHVAKDAVKAKPKQAKRASSQQAAHRSPSRRTRSSQNSPGTTAGSTSVVARAAVVSEPPAAPASDNGNADPQVQVLSTSMRLVPEQSEGEYCGLASNLELRTGVAQEANKRARHDSKRRIGAHAETLDQQGDATSTAAIQTAMTAVARAADTVFYPNRTKGQAHESLVMIPMNQVARRRRPAEIPAKAGLRARRRVSRLPGLRTSKSCWKSY
jgi:hypothetical protein